MSRVIDMIDMLFEEEDSLTGWEMDFLEDISCLVDDSGEGALSEAQREKLEEIFNKRC